MFKNVKYLDKGGFSTIYEANISHKKLVLKCINCFDNLNENLNENLREFFNEV